LIDPLQVSPAARSDGTVVQSIAEAGGVVTVTTLQRPTGATAASALTPQQAAWLEALALVHGLTAPLVVTTTNRTAGALTQTLESDGETVTVTRA
jgi:hypothetical protein